MRVELQALFMQEWRLARNWFLLLFAARWSSATLCPCPYVPSLIWGTPLPHWCKTSWCFVTSLILPAAGTSDCSDIPTC